MKSRAELVAWKKRQLLEECRMQREELARQLRPVGYQLESVDSGIRIISRIRQHPEWIAGLGVGVLLLTPRRLSSWFRIGSSAVRTWRSIAPALKMISQRRS